MNIIKTQEKYKEALEDIEKLIDLDPAPNTPEGERLELLSLIISDYEDRPFPLELPDPIEAIKFRMEQQGLKQKDLAPFIGSESKVSEVLNRKRSLSLNMIRSLHTNLGIPLDVLIQKNKEAA